MQPVFILGTGRCGSTFLHSILSVHQDVGYLSTLDNTPWVASKGRWNRLLANTSPGGVRVLGGRVRVGPSEGYRALGREVSPGLVAPYRDLVAADATPLIRERFRRFFEERAAIQGVDVFVHKFSGWPRAGFIQTAFPTARFIHVIRDGRAVAASLIREPWWRGWLGVPEWGFGHLDEGYAKAWEDSGDSFIVLAGLEWMVLHDAFDAAKELIPPESWMELRYEDLVAAPAASITRVLEFTGLPVTDRFRRLVRRIPVDRSRTDAFSKELPPRDLEALEAALGERLRRMGYAVPSVA